MPILVGAHRELEYDDWQIRHRLVQIRAPKLVIERGKEQRRGLARNAGDCQKHASEDPGARRAPGYRADDCIARRAERHGRFA